MPSVVHVSVPKSLYYWCRLMRRENAAMPPPSSHAERSDETTPYTTLTFDADVGYLNIKETTNPNTNVNAPHWTAAGPC